MAINIEMNIDIKRTQSTLCLTLLTMFFLSACGGSSGDGTSTPTVSSTSPEDVATGVARDSTITATFDDDILATTVDATSFTLSEAGSGSTSGSVSFDAINNVASLTPDNALEKLTTYTANLSTAITDLDGNPLSSDYSWSFTTADGAWGSAALIESEDAGDGLSPQIAVDDSGNAVAVWQQFDGAQFNIWANHYDGSSWGSAEMISDGTKDARTPQIAFDGNGNALAVWQEFSIVRYGLRSRSFDGSSWTNQFSISTGGTGDADFPQIAVDNSGNNALVVWQESDGVRTNIWANRYFDNSSGRGWDVAVLLESDNTGDAISPQIAGDGNGNALAVWLQSDGTRFNIWANRFDGSNWGSAELIESDNTGDAISPQIAGDDSGNATAVWVQSDGFRFNVWVNRYDGSSWGSAELIESDNAGGASTPQIAVNDNGNATAVWVQSDGIRSNAWANQFDGSSWGNAVLIETDNAGNVFTPQIAVDDSGNALAVWRQFDGTVFNIRANRFVGNSWGSAELIESDDTGIARNPQIAVNDSGEAVAVWRQSDGTRFNIWANRFE